MEAAVSRRAVSIGALGRRSGDVGSILRLRASGDEPSGAAREAASTGAALPRVTAERRSGNR